MEKLIPNIVSIAGVDPSGGAGVLADLKAMSALAPLPLTLAGNSLGATRSGWSKVL